MSTLFPCFLPAIVIDSTNNKLSVTVTGGTGAGTSTLTIASGTYYLRGDGASGDFLAALDTALESHSTTGAFACTVSRNIASASSGCSVTLTLSGGPTSWTINTSSNTTFDLSWIGMSSGMTAALSLSSTSTVKGCWTSSEPMSLDDPGWSSMVRQSQLSGGSVSTHIYGATTKERTYDCDYLYRERVFETTSLDTPHKALGHLMLGGKFERHDTTVSSGTTLSALSSSTRIGTLWHFAEESCKSLRPSRVDPGLELWGITVSLIGGEAV